jgi:ribosome-associated toxin RatA of RatAB toxin-antitoxin module
LTLLTGDSSREIDAPIARCWEVIEEIERSPQWQNGLKSIEVLQRDAQGRAILCDATIDAKLRKVSARVRVSYDAPRGLVFERESSEDLDELRGSWELEELSPSRTRATYRLAVDPGPVGFLARPLERALRPIVVGARADELAREVAAGPR